METTTYTIAADEHYGWLTGLSHDGQQLLVADNVMLCFDINGLFLQAEFFVREETWKERASKLIAISKPIQVQEFCPDEHEISVRSLPKSYARFLSAPDSFSIEEQAHYRDCFSDWKNKQLFEFTLGDDFWMNPDGTVSSH